MTMLNKYIDMKSSHGQNMIMTPYGHMGIPRSEMPQISHEHRNAFIAYIESKGIKVTNQSVPIQSLKMAQGDYNREKVHSIIKNGDKGTDPIFISLDNMVVDGNHRMLAKLNTGAKNIKVTRLGMNAKELLDVVHEFPLTKRQSLQGKALK